MAITGKKLSELLNKVPKLTGRERLYVSDGTNVPKYIDTEQIINAAKADSVLLTEQTLTEEQKTQVQNNIGVTPVPIGGWNRQLYEAAGAKYNEETGYYELNGLTDLTEEEIATAYAETNNFFNFIVGRGAYSGLRCRTNFPIQNSAITTYQTYDLTQAFNGTLMEVLNLAPRNTSEESVFYPIKTSSLSFMGQSSAKIKKVIGIIDCAGVINNQGVNIFTTSTCIIEDIRLKNIKVNSSLKYCATYTYNTFRYLVDNLANEKAITITVHPTTYGYLTGTIEPTPEVGGTKEEWMQIAADASEKQCSFASA